MQLTIDNLTKRYGGGVQALTNLSLNVGAGVLGLLGPNGAGKSTLMRILATITRPTSGKVLWNGGDAARDPDELRNVLGYLPQDFGVYPNLSALEFLEYLAAVKGIARSTCAAPHQRIARACESYRCCETPARRLLRRHAAACRNCAGSAQRSAAFDCR